MESSNPEIRSGYRPPDEDREPETDDTSGKEFLEVSKIAVKAARSNSPAMYAVWMAELQRIAAKYGLAPISNEDMKRLFPHRMKKPLLDIDSVLSRIVIEQD